MQNPTFMQTDFDAVYDGTSQGDVIVNVNNLQVWTVQRRYPSRPALENAPADCASLNIRRNLDEVTDIEQDQAPQEFVFATTYASRIYSELVNQRTFKIADLSRALASHADLPFETARVYILRAISETAHVYVVSLDWQAEFDFAPPTPCDGAIARLGRLLEGCGNTVNLDVLSLLYMAIDADNHNVINQLFFASRKNVL